MEEKKTAKQKSEIPILPLTDEKVLAHRLALCQQLYDHAKARNITHDEIARRAGFTESNVSRMLSGKYSPSLDNLIKLCNAVGLNIQFKKSRK